MPTMGAKTVTSFIGEDGVIATYKLDDSTST